VDLGKWQLTPPHHSGVWERCGHWPDGPFPLLNVVYAGEQLHTLCFTTAVSSLSTAKIMHSLHTKNALVFLLSSGPTPSQSFSEIVFRYVFDDRH